MKEFLPVIARVSCVKTTKITPAVIFSWTFTRTQVYIYTRGYKLLKV